MQNAKYFKLTRRFFTQRNAMSLFYDLDVKISKICLRAKELVYIDTEKVVGVTVT